MTLDEFKEYKLTSCELCGGRRLLEAKEVTNMYKGDLIKEFVVYDVMCIECTDMEQIFVEIEG